VRDHAWISVDGMPVGTLSRTLHEDALLVPPGRRLRVLVEEQGRVNYASRLGEPKGLIGEATLDGEPLRGWTATPIDVAAAGALVADWDESDDGVRGMAGPFAWRGSFSLDRPADLFLDTAAWGRGYALVNGFVLGRYRRSGPKRTLYVPAPVLRRWSNSLVVIELDHVTDPVARFASRPELGPREE